MPYLQVDLDGKRKWPMVANGCGIPEAQVCKGLLDLWESCWRAKSSGVSLLLLECLFDMPGRGERAAEVLCAFGFLEVSANGLRVCGAERYLRITEARSAGGKKASGNLKRGKSPGSSRKAAGSQPESTSGSRPALTPITEHHTPSSKDLPPVAAEAPGRFEALKKKLVAQFEAFTKSKYGWQGGDPRGLKALMGFGTDEEIQARLANGLKATGYPHTASIAQLASKWNEPEVRGSGPPRRAGGARFVAAQDVDKTSFAKVGTVNDF